MDFSMATEDCCFIVNVAMGGKFQVQVLKMPEWSDSVGKHILF